MSSPSRRGNWAAVVAVGGGECQGKGEAALGQLQLEAKRRHQAN